MDLNALDLALAVARRGSFAAVARERELDRSSVSRAISALEGEIGVRLFQRTSRTLTLTEAGEAYLARVAAAREEIDRAREEALELSTVPSGTLRLSASISFGVVFLVPLLERFRATYPRLKVEAHLTDEQVDLVDKRIDLGVRIGPAVTGDLIASKLFEFRYRVLASPDYLATNTIASPAALSNHPVITFSYPQFRHRWLWRAGPDETVAEIPITPYATFSNAIALRDAALAGLGPTLFADRFVTREVAEGRLIDVFPEDEFAANTFTSAAWLIYPSRAFLPNKVRVAIDFLRAEVGARLGEG
ncbi:MAG: LysR family transcriptional regulator [Pseudomonadota bacterium]